MMAKLFVKSTVAHEVHRPTNLEEFIQINAKQLGLKKSPFTGLYVPRRGRRSEIFTIDIEGNDLTVRVKNARRPSAIYPPYMQYGEVRSLVEAFVAYLAAEKIDPIQLNVQINVRIVVVIS